MDKNIEKELIKFNGYIGKSFIIDKTTYAFISFFIKGISFDDKNIDYSIYCKYSDKNGNSYEKDAHTLFIEMGNKM